MASISSNALILTVSAFATAHSHGIPFILWMILDLSGALRPRTQDGGGKLWTFLARARLLKGCAREIMSRLLCWLE
jgi:hypothetical protein